MFGGQVGIAGHIHIGNKVNLGAQSGVPSSIKDGSQLIGTPPMELKPIFQGIHRTKKFAGNASGTAPAPQRIE